MRGEMANLAAISARLGWLLPPFSAGSSDPYYAKCASHICLREEERRSCIPD